MYLNILGYYALNGQRCLSSNLIMKKNCKNEAKMSNLTITRKNGIQNIEVDIAVMCSIKKDWAVWIKKFALEVQSST